MKKRYIVLIIIISFILIDLGIKKYNSINQKDKKAFEYTKIQETISNESEGLNFVLKNNNGFVNVYIVDDIGNENLYLATDIAVLYLPELDQINLEKGIYIYGKEKLIEILQDFE